MPPVPRRSINLPAPGTKRAVVIGAGSFGTAVAVLLARGGMRTTLQARTLSQAQALADQRENSVYLSGVELPRELRIEHVGAGALARADYVFLGVPSVHLEEVIGGLDAGGLPAKAAIVSLAKGLVPPEGEPPTALIRRRYGAERTACIGGPAHAREMVSEGAGLVAASSEESLAAALAGVFLRAGVMCEESNDPVGVELAGAAKNAAALASGATEAQGLNAAGAAAGHIFAEVWRWAESQGARPESMIGLAGTGDLVATALAPQSRNRRAGELLAAGVPAAEIPDRVGSDGRGARIGAAVGQCSGASRRRRARDERARAADRRPVAASGLGRGRAHHDPASAAVAAGGAPRRLAAAAGAHALLEPALLQQALLGRSLLAQACSPGVVTMRARPCGTSVTTIASFSRARRLPDHPVVQPRSASVVTTASYTPAP